MEYVFLGNTGVKVSSLCYGTMSFGGDADEAMSKKLFYMCRDAGINFFDCADVYQDGLSEKILGKLIQDCRDEVFITSKVYFATGKDVNAMGASRYHMVRALDASLKRLNTDYIDLYFIHRFDDRTPLEESLQALDDFVRQGKILYIGASNFAAWQLSKALGLSALNGWSKIACIQPMYNLLKRQAEVEIFPMALAEDLGVINYSPLAGGLLSGKYGTNKRPDSGRLTENKMYQTRYADQWMFEVADGLIQLAAELAVHPASLAIAWTGAHEAVTSPIIGARNIDQLKVCLEASDISIDRNLWKRISELSYTPPPATDRNEEKTNENYGLR